MVDRVKQVAGAAASNEGLVTIGTGLLALTKEAFERASGWSLDFLLISVGLLILSRVWINYTIGRRNLRDGRSDKGTSSC